MTTKEWLSRGRGINQRIKELEREKQQAFELAVSVAGTAAQEEKVQCSSGNSSERKILKYTEIAMEIESEKEALLKILQEINAAICAVNDINLRRLLSLRYIEFMTWEKIAEEMNYSDKWVRTRLHANALAEIKKQIIV